MFSQLTRWIKYSIVGAMALTIALFVLAAASFAQGEIKPINSGFDPVTHAFSFENYGGDSGATNLTPVEMVRLFGDKVCASKAGGACLLSPVAKQWMEEINQAMNGGHCEGMAVLSALMYTGKIKPADFGGAQVKDLQIAGNEKLQREIAYWWATQTTQPTRGAVLKGPPSAVVAFLADAFKPGKSADITYSVGIYKRDGTGGHAVTPYAIEDKGGGIFAIMVYDNNFPNLPREILVDVNKNIWQYEASINPGVPAALYEGDADTKSLDLTPSAPRLEAQVCTFCEGATTGYRGPGVAAPVTPFNEIHINGGGVRVLITDAQGRRLGRIAGKLVNEIPGAEVATIKSLDTWSLTTEPIYRIPLGVKFVITLDGAELKKETQAEIAMIGPGYALEVQDIKLAPGQKDTLDVAPDGSKLSYKPGASESPDIVIAIEGKDNVDYEFFVKGFELETGGALNVALDVKKGQLLLSTVGNKQAGAYVLAIGRYDAQGIQEFGGELKLEPADTVYVDYLKWQGNGKPMTVEIDYKSDGSIDETVELEDLNK
jgi:hypothetical protein